LYFLVHKHVLSGERIKLGSTYRFVQIFHLLGWAKSDANTNLDSGRNSDASANRSGSDVESNAWLNLYLFNRYVSVERGQRYYLFARDR